MTNSSGHPSRSPLAETVRRLRHALDETQDAFARRLQTTVRTVARYESIAPPRGFVLTRLAHIAASNQLPDLAQLFQDAIDAEVGAEHVSASSDFYAETFTKPREIMAVASLVEALRNPRHASIAAKALKALAPLIEERKQAQEQIRRSMEVADALLVAYRQGKTDREIAEFFDLTPEAVREWRRINKLEDNARVTGRKRKK